MAPEIHLFSHLVIIRRAELEALSSRSLILPFAFFFPFEDLYFQVTMCFYGNLSFAPYIIDLQCFMDAILLSG